MKKSAVNAGISTPNNMALGGFLVIAISAFSSGIARLIHPKYPNLSEDLKVQEIPKPEEGAQVNASSQDNVNPQIESEKPTLESGFKSQPVEEEEQQAASENGQEQQAAVEQPLQATVEQTSVDSALEFFKIHFLAKIDSHSFERSNPVTKTQDLKGLRTKMICDKVNVSEFKQFCESNKDNCFLGKQYDAFFGGAINLEQDFMAGDFKCQADDDFGSANK